MQVGNADLQVLQLFHPDSDPALQFSPACLIEDLPVFYGVTNLVELGLFLPLALHLLGFTEGSDVDFEPNGEERALVFQLHEKLRHGKPAVTPKIENLVQISLSVLRREWFHEVRHIARHIHMIAS